jgi:hypothetical protein
LRHVSNNFWAQSLNDPHADGATVPGVAINGGIDSGATVVVGIGLALGNTGLAVIDGAAMVGAGGAPGARVVTVVTALDEAVATVDDSAVAVGSSMIAVLEDPPSDSSSLTTALSVAVDVVESPDRVRLHTTIAIPRMKTMIETGVSHFRDMGRKYQMPDPPKTTPKS